MIDTFQISKTFARSPLINELQSNGWNPLWSRYTGEPTALCFNSGEGKPRLTLSKNPNDHWNIRAEVSLGSWLYGSNLHLPDYSEFHCGLDLLSKYVESKSGISFDAHAARVSRVDFTRDFHVGENAVIPIIAKFGKLKLSRCKQVRFDATSVYFKNKGKEKTKEFLIYSKYQERLDNCKDTAQQKAAKGLIRLEVSFRKSGVTRLAKSLKLPNHNANHILTKETSEEVIQRAMKRLNFLNLLTVEKPNIEKLFESCSTTAALSYVGFLYMKEKYGEDLSRLPFVEISHKTLKRYEDECRRAGVCSLE